MTDLNPEALEKALDVFFKKFGSGRWSDEDYAIYRGAAEAAITTYLAALPRTDLVERLLGIADEQENSAKNLMSDILPGDPNARTYMTVAALRFAAGKDLRQAAAVISATGDKALREVHNSALEEAAKTIDVKRVFYDSEADAAHKVLLSDVTHRCLAKAAAYSEAVREIRALKLPENGGKP